MTDISRALRGVSLRQLRTFYAVARHKSFTGAARELHVTQPAVSMQMRELESSCGIALYERIGRRIQLTEAGDELAACATGIMDLLLQTQERLGAMQGLRGGTLKLGAISTAKYFTPALLSAFKQLYPSIAFRFMVGNREEVVRKLADNECDLVIMGRPPAELDTVANPFAVHPLVIVAAPGHNLAGRKRLPFARLAKENFLIREPGSGTRAAMEETFRAQDLRYAASMEMSSNETIKQAVIAGMGVAFISAHTVGLELATGRLVTLNVTGLPVLRNWYAIHLTSKRLSPIAATFRDFLLERGRDVIADAIQQRD